MQRDCNIKIEQVGLFDVFTLQVVSVVGFEAIDDGVPIGLQIIHDLFENMVAPCITCFVADSFRHGRFVAV